MNHTRDITIESKKHHEDAALLTYNNQSASTTSTQDSGGSNKVTPDRPSPLKRKIKQQAHEGPPLSPSRRDHESEFLSSPGQSYQHRFFPSTPQYDHIYASAESPYSPFPLIALSGTPNTPKRVRLADDVVFKNRPYSYSPSPRKSYPTRRAPSNYSREHSSRVGLPMTETQRKAARDVEKFQRKEYQYYNAPSYSHPSPVTTYQSSPKMSSISDDKLQVFGKESMSEGITHERIPETSTDESLKETADTSHLIESESNGALSQSTSDVKQDTASEESVSESKDDSKQSLKTSPPRNTPSKEERSNNANLITPSENDESRKSASYTYDNSYAGDSPYKSAPTQPLHPGMYGPSFYGSQHSSQGSQYRYPPSSPVKNSVSRGYNYGVPPHPHGGGTPHYYSASYYHPSQGSHQADHQYYDGSRNESSGYPHVNTKRMSGEEGGQIRRSEGRPSHPYYSAPSVTESFDSDSHHRSSRERSPSKRSGGSNVLKSSSYEDGGRHSRHSSSASLGHAGDEYGHDPRHHYGHQPSYPGHAPRSEYYHPNESNYPPHRYPVDFNPGPPPGPGDGYYDRAPYEYYGGREPNSEYYYGHPPPYAKEDVHPLMRDQYENDKDRRISRKDFGDGDPNSRSIDSKQSPKSPSPLKREKKIKNDGESSVKTSSSGSSSPRSKPSTKAQAAIAAGLTEPPSASEVSFDIHNPPLHPQVPPSNEPVCPVAAGVNSQDVLCGRGGGTNTQIGNRRFRSLVQEFQPTYLLCRRKEKPLIARTIVLIVRGRGGRFLKKDDTTGMLFEVGDEKAEAKTSQALREGLDVRSSKHSTPSANSKKKKKEKNTSKKADPDRSNDIAPRSSPDTSNHREGPPPDLSYPYPYYGSGMYETQYGGFEDHQPYTVSRKRSRPNGPSNSQWYPYPPKGYGYPPPHQDYYQAFQPPQETLETPGGEENSVWEDDFSPPRPKKAKSDVELNK